MLFRSSSSSNTSSVTELEQKFNKQITELEQKHTSEIASEKTKYQKQIETLQEEASSSKQKIETYEKSKQSIVTNPKKFGIGLGYTLDKMYSAEVSYQFYGSLYGQISSDSDFKNYRARFTIGVRL